MSILTDKPQSWQKWMTTTWRPLMAVTYMATIWFDFIIGPIIFNMLQFRSGEQLISSWTPLTLQGGGLYHLAMGAVLGIAAWTRGQEKVASMNSPTGYDSDEYYNPNAVYQQQPMPTGPGWINRDREENNGSYNNSSYNQYQPPVNAYEQQQEQYYQPPVNTYDMPQFTDDPHAYPNRPLRRQRM
jgi:hypothetical protein